MDIFRELGYTKLKVGQRVKVIDILEDNNEVSIGEKYTIANVHKKSKLEYCKYKDRKSAYCCNTDNDYCIEVYTRDGYSLCSCYCTLKKCL